MEIPKQPTATSHPIKTSGLKWLGLCSLLLFVFAISIVISFAIIGLPTPAPTSAQRGVELREQEFDAVTTHFPIQSPSRIIWFYTPFPSAEEGFCFFTKDALYYYDTMLSEFLKRDLVAFDHAEIDVKGDGESYTEITVHQMGHEACIGWVLSAEQNRDELFIQDLNNAIEVAHRQRIEKWRAELEDAQPPEKSGFYITREAVIDYTENPKYSEISSSNDYYWIYPSTIHNETELKLEITSHVIEHYLDGEWVRWHQDEDYIEMARQTFEVDEEGRVYLPSQSSKDFSHAIGGREERIVHPTSIKIAAVDPDGNEYQAEQVYIHDLQALKDISKN